MRSNFHKFSGYKMSLMLGAFFTFGLVMPAFAQQPIKIGLIASLSKQSARAGEAISRGLSVAIDELNASGGILGRKFELVRRDDESMPAKGVIAARELIFKERVAVIFGGLDTPVSVAIASIVNAKKVPFMSPWAAGTQITRNGASPNYVFRVSAVDEIVDRAMVRYSQKMFNAKKPGLILVNNPWGESNKKGLIAALDALNMKAAGIEKMESSDVDVVSQLARLKSSGADVLFLVGNVGPASQVVKSLERMGWKVPVVSHWGPAGGRFTELGGPRTRDVHIVQTYSFFGKQSVIGEKVLKMLMEKYPDIKEVGDATPAVGIANAYDAMHLTALAIKLAGNLEGDAIREAFYKIDHYDGLIKKYKKPFSPGNHDALNENDYIWTRFVDNRIVPIGYEE